MEKEGLVMRKPSVSWSLYSVVVSTVMLQEEPLKLHGFGSRRSFLTHMCGLAEAQLGLAPVHGLDSGFL